MNRSKQAGMGIKAFVVLLVGLALWSIPFAEAQQSGKVSTIGILSPGSAKLKDSYVEFVESFRQGLRDLGYLEDKNVLLEYRYAEGNLDRMPGLVAELVQLKPAVIVVSAVPAIRAAKEMTRTIPIVMITTVDPVAMGIVDSLARPGGNMTGLALLTRDLSAKRLELLTEVLQKKSRVAVLWDSDAPGPKVALEEYKAVAPAMNLQLQSLEVRGPTPGFRRGISGCGQGTRTGPCYYQESFTRTLHEAGRYACD